MAAGGPGRPGHHRRGPRASARGGTRHWQRGESLDAARVASGAGSGDRRSQPRDVAGDDDRHADVRVGGGLLHGAGHSPGGGGVRLQADFVAAVSHEFRSPLTTVRQMAEMLEMGGLQNDERRQTDPT